MYSDRFRQGQHPVYDTLVGSFDAKRRDSLRLLDPRPGERVLLVGAGTGADLPHLPPGCVVLATDLPAMLTRARPRVRPGTHLVVMDGQQLAAPAAAFDAVVLHLILAVIPDPVRCLHEAARVLAPGGRIAVFDKFLPDAERPSPLRRAANVVSSVLFTDINRRLGAILAESGAGLVLSHEEPAVHGFYRIALLRKP